MTPRTFGMLGMLGLVAALGAAYVTGPIPGVLQSSLVNSDVIALYVDPLTGNDGNACISAAAPCLTCNGAISKLPKLIGKRAVVTLAAGTYSTAGSGCAVDQISMLPFSDSTSTADAQLIFQGTLENVTPATGSATGTLSSFAASSSTAFAVATDSAATWTVNDFQGKLFVTTGGTGSGKTYAIISNTATAITLAGTITTMSATTTYAIQDSGTNMSGFAVSGSGPNSVAQAIFMVGGGTPAAKQSGNGSDGQSTGDLQIKWIKFSGSSTSITSSGALQVSVFANHFAGNQNCVVQLGNARMSVVANSYTSTGTFSGMYAASSDASVGAQVTATGNVQIAGGTMFNFKTGTALLTRNYGNGMTGSGMILSRGANVNSTQDRFTGILGATNPCLSLAAGTGLSRPSSSYLSATNVDCASGASDAVYVDGSSQALLSTVTGTGNTGYGVRAEYGGRVEITSTTTVTGTTNDILIDGTAYTYVVLRALIPKTIFTNGTLVYER